MECRDNSAAADDALSSDGQIDTMVTRDMNHDAMNEVALHDSILERDAASVDLRHDADPSQSIKRHDRAEAMKESATTDATGSIGDDEPFISQMKEPNPLRRTGGLANPIPKTALYRKDSEQDELDEEESALAPPNTYHMEMELEAARLSQRNKRVLITRLVEASPRGKLSLVRPTLSSLCCFISL